MSRAGSPVLKCGRCRRRYRHGAADATEWNATVKGGVIVGVLCPGCQTQAENTEAVINEATLDYGLDRLGRLTGRAKATSS